MCIDFRKAFDTTMYATITKLHKVRIGKTSKAWITNYLFNRKENVVYEHCNMRICPVLVRD